MVTVNTGQLQRNTGQHEDELFRPGTVFPEEALPGRKGYVEKVWSEQTQRGALFTGRDIINTPSNTGHTCLENSMYSQMFSYVLPWSRQISPTCGSITAHKILIQGLILITNYMAYTTRFLLDSSSILN